MESPSYECCTALAIIGMISTDIGNREPMNKTQVKRNENYLRGKIKLKDSNGIVKRPSKMGKRATLKQKASAIFMRKWEIKGNQLIGIARLAFPWSSSQIRALGPKNTW